MNSAVSHLAALAKVQADELTSDAVVSAPERRNIMLAKVQADELTSDASGYVTERPATDCGIHRLASAVDREATFRKHDHAAPAVLGTSAVIITTATRIRACVALPGSTPDSVTPVAVLQQQQAAGHPLPPHLVMDRAGGRGKTRAQVDAISKGQTAMMAWMPQSGGTDTHRFYGL